MRRLLTLLLLFISTSSYTQGNLKSATDSVFWVYHSLWISLNQDKVEESVRIKFWTDFINLYQDDYRGYEQRALLYRISKVYKSSIEDYSKVIELKPWSDHNAYSGRSGKSTQNDPLNPFETDPLIPFQIDPLIPGETDPLKIA